HDHVAIASDVERGDGDLQALERSQKLPVSVDVAIPVQPAAKAGAREFSAVEIQVVLCQPDRQRKWGRTDVKKTSPTRHHPHPGCRLACWSIARAAIQHRVERTSRIGFEFCFGDAGLLKVELIEERVLI